MDTYKLWYDKCAEDSDFGWEKQSIPIGNGFLGGNVFGITGKERIQITENSMVNTYQTGGLNNFAELMFEFDHGDHGNEKITDYERSLDLNDAIAQVKYRNGKTIYQREYFASYPDKVIVMRFTASERGKLTFSAVPKIPFCKEYAVNPGDGGGKTGSVTADGDTLFLKGKLHYYDVFFEGQLKILKHNGRIRTSSDCISVEGADEAVLIFAGGTNYRLDSSVFLEDDPKKKLKAFDPHQKVSEIITNASRPYEELKRRHLEDYRALFGRVSLSIGEMLPENKLSENCTTDELLRRYRKERNPQLEALIFQYGRYLLISSSRKGGLPCNLQGIWNCYDQSPWGSGYWHNINVQMNYWPAFATNLLETFEAYVDFYQAFLPKARKYADSYVREHNPENADADGANGWTIGTASYPYTISEPGGHSGPGTGGLTSKLFWEYYAFSGDKKILKDVTYPALSEMARFLTKTVEDYDGQYLASFSASPEQMVNGVYTRGGAYYQTVGCAFDQQMIYENGKDLLRAADILGETRDPVLKVQEKQIAHYAPVEIGWSGQIKEYREEHFYGEVGEYRHRHISQLMALYPGSLINTETDAWMDAAKYTLIQRGDKGGETEDTGWGIAHRLNTWARAGEGDHCLQLLSGCISRKINANLWNANSPYQIDGNLGIVSGIAEMLLQSHEEYINILPALPEQWKEGECSGLLARGGFEIGIKWMDHAATEICVKSLAGGMLKLRYPGISTAEVSVNVTIVDYDRISFEMKPGDVYHIYPQKQYRIKIEQPENLQIDTDTMTLSWNGVPECKYRIYRALESAPCYECVANGIEDTFWRDDLNFSEYETVTYKVTATSGGTESNGIYQTINHGTKLQKAIYYNQLIGRRQI